MRAGSRRTRWTSRNFRPGADGSPSRAFQTLISVIPYLTMARVFAGLGLWVVFSTASPAADADTGEAALELADQTTFVEADGTMIFDLAVDPGDAAAPVVSVVVYGTVATEDELDGPLPQVLNRLEPRRLTQLEQRADGTYRLEVPIRPGQPFDDVDRMKLPTAGVYPVQIELRTIEGPIATALTHVVRLTDTAPVDGAETEADVSDPIEVGPVALVIPVSAHGLSVADAITVFDDHPATPLTVLLDVGTVDQLQAEPATRANLARALRERPVLVRSEPTLDPSALAEIDQLGIFDELAAATTETVASLGLTPAVALHLLDTRPTAAGLAALETTGVTSILNIGGRTRDAGTFRGNNGPIRMVVADAELSALLDRSDNNDESVGDSEGVHRVNRLLTRLVLQSQDEPTAATVLAPLGPDRRTIDTLLRAAAAGPVDPVLVTDVWRVGGQGRTGWLSVAERPRQDLSPVADLLWRVQQKLTTYEEFTSTSQPDDGSNGTDRTDGTNVVPADLSEQIRRGVATALGTGSTPTIRVELLESLEETLNQQLAVIELHEGQPVTLAARSASIPVVVESAAAGPRKVMLRLNSDKVRSVDDATIIEIPPGTSSIDVELETSSLGVSPMEVSMWTPDGLTELTSTQYQVRSTAIPGLGLLVTGGAVLLLIVWWVMDARRNRRERSEPLAHESTGSASV